jgi:hypothetical protein
MFSNINDLFIHIDMSSNYEFLSKPIFLSRRGDVAHWKTTLKGWVKYELSSYYCTLLCPTSSFIRTLPFIITSVVQFVFRIFPNLLKSYSTLHATTLRPLGISSKFYQIAWLWYRKAMYKLTNYFALLKYSFIYTKIVFLSVVVFYRFDCDFYKNYWRKISF